MKKFFIFALVLVLGTATQSFATTVNYTADNTTIFPNPERGFIDQLEKVVSQSSPYLVKGNEWYFQESGEREDQRLVLCLYYLDNFRNTATLPTAVLNAFDEDMAVLRQYGYKCILRYAYGTSSSDAPLNIVLSHIEQLKSHWQANADVIYVMQAGFVGAWGEWYYTNNFDNQSCEMTASRRQLVDALLSAVPQDRFIQLRCPSFKIGYFGDENPLTADQAFNGSARARFGHHNDAFLNKYGDSGTYNIVRNGQVKEDTTALKPYIAQETLYVPIGGETNIESESTANSNATYAKTTAEMSRLHWSFCKAGYAETTTNKWRQEGTFDELNRKMGYRYQLVTATFPATANAGGQAAINIQIKNVGYAPLYNERHAYIVLKNGNNTYPVQLQSDPRRWLPNGVVTTINEQITIPANVPAGTYQLYLNMPDAYASLASNPKYSIRFANANVWDANTGMNNLNASITIQTGTDDPTPVDPPTPVTADITIDGDFSDWSALTDAAQAELPGGATLNGLYKTRWYANESDIFYYIEYNPDLVAHLDIYLSTDGNISTGHNSWNWTNSGIEYLIEGEAESFGDAALFAFDSSDQSAWSWSDTEIASFQTVSAVVNLTNGHKAIEGKISQAALPTTTVELYVGVYASNEGWEDAGKLPQGNGGSAVDMLEVPIHKNPTGLGNTQETLNNQAYDILGRPVNDDFRGVVIINGQKVLRLQ